MGWQSLTKSHDCSMAISPRDPPCPHRRPAVHHRGKLRREDGTPSGLQKKLLYMWLNRLWFMVDVTIVHYTLANDKSCLGKVAEVWFIVDITKQYTIHSEWNVNGVYKPTDNWGGTIL